MVKITDIRSSKEPFCLPWILLGALCLIWFFRKLSTVPDSYNPDIFSFYTIKEPVWTYNNFTKRKIRKLR